ncbi:phenoloxidase-activating factor 2-like isoform X1 [Macrobrachium nipponense]|uniref:phenoloxidase-activating factor 2-like isoform X1 n=2 Tax=Macrobrachium nipponense TaxID=159736 RepID=UPI0030C89A91
MSRMMWAWLQIAALLAGTLATVSARAQSDLENEFGCHCMEYWTCITRGGQPYSYCGLSASSVCCFVPLNAKPVGILPVTRRNKSCGTKGAEGRKEGQAEMSEWPWHAAILEQPQDLYVCGASLLDEAWLLTAAHCVDDYLNSAKRLQEVLKVRLGEYDVSTTAEPLRHEEFPISRIVIHPEFDNATLVNDIALLQLERPARRKANIDAVCMPKKNDFLEGTTTRCFVTGWGRKDEASDHSVVLKEINVPLWSNPTCQNALRDQFGPGYSLPSTALCAGAEGRDACDGDGGGPLVCEKDGHWYQVGVVSFGIGCGRRNIPGVYTRVGAFEEWIMETTGVHHHA